MAGSRRITVEFLGKDTNLGKTATAASSKLRGAGKAADDSSKGFGRASAGIGKLVGAFAGLAIGTKVVGFLKDSVGEAREAQKVSALTAQVIKTTGGAAKVTAKQVGELSAAISNKSGIDDEAIQSGANLLLTFKNIKNEAGKGNNIFDQTTQIMTDMGAAMGKEPKAAAIQLGKALNDPIKGVSALAKVGVTFDDKQKAVIKRLVETGDVAGAQKVILKELKSEFGGAAAASSTAGEKAAVAWGNLKEEIGAKLLPVIDKVSVWFVNKGVPAISKFGGAISKTAGFIKEHKTALTLAAGAMAALLAVTKVHSAFLAVQAAGGVLKFIKATTLVTKLTKTWAAVQWVLNAALTANPIGIVIVAIAALVAGIIYAWKNSKTFREVVTGAFRAIADAGKWMWDKVLKPTFRFVTKAWITVAEWIIKGAAKAFGWVPGLGPKLKAAAAKFEDFKNTVNRKLDGVKPAKIKVEDAEARRKVNSFRNFFRDQMGLVRRNANVHVGVSGAGIGGLLGQTTKKHEATGGSVFAGRGYIVGENGPETFIPTGNGRIAPTRRTGGAGNTYHIHIHGVTDKNGAAREIRKVLVDYKRSIGGRELGIA